MACEEAVTFEVELDLTLPEDILALGILVSGNRRISIEDARKTCPLADKVPIFLDVRI